MDAMAASHGTSSSHSHRTARYHYTQMRRGEGEVTTRGSQRLSTATLEVFFVGQHGDGRRDGQPVLSNVLVKHGKIVHQTDSYPYLHRHRTGNQPCAVLLLHTCS